MPAVAVADHADLELVVLRLEPVDRREHLLHLVAGERAAHLVGHAVDELAVREVRLRGSSFGLPERSSLRSMSVGNEHAAAVSGEPQRRTSSPFVRPASSSGNWSACGMATTFAVRLPLRFDEQPFGVDAGQHRPAHRVDLAAVDLGEERRLARPADVLQVRLHALIDHAEHLPEPLALRGQRLREAPPFDGEIDLPHLVALRRRGRQFAVEVLVDPRDHLGREVAVVGERLGVGKRLGGRISPQRTQRTQRSKSRIEI